MIQCLVLLELGRVICIQTTSNKLTKIEMDGSRSCQMKSLKMSLPLDLTFIACITSLNQFSSLDLYLFGKPTLPYYFHSSFTQVPTPLDQHLPNNQDVFLFIRQNHQKVAILWQDQMVSTFILMRLTFPDGKCPQLCLERKFKDSSVLQQVCAWRKMNQIKLNKREINSLSNILSQYQYLENLKQIKSQNSYKGTKNGSSLVLDQNKVLKRSLPFLSFLQEELSRKKAITDKRAGQVVAMSMPKRSTRLHETGKQEDLALRLYAVNQVPKDKKTSLDFTEKLKLALERAQLEAPNINKQPSFQNNPLLMIRGQEQQFKHNKGKDQPVPLDFTKSLFYNKFHCKIENEYLSVVKICNDHSFYHLNHSRPILQELESIACIMGSVHNHDFTVGILGKDSLNQPRKQWPLHIIAYIGCVHLIVKGLQCMKVPVVFQRGDELRVCVSMAEKTVRFYGNNLLIGEQRIPTEMAAECYFFYETSTSGNKVLFLLPTS